MTEIELEYPGWRDLILVCRKCSHRHEDGFGRDGEQSLPKALKSDLKARHMRRHVRVVEVDCLDLCPKHGVSVMRLSDPGHIAVVPEGASVADIWQRLGLDPDARGP